MLEIIKLLLEELDSDNNHMPPTVLYNEGWLLRLIIWWFSQNRKRDFPLTFCSGAEWYSERLLTTPFLPVYQGDKLAESYTHADGIIGSIKRHDNEAGERLARFYGLCLEFNSPKS